VTDNIFKNEMSFNQKMSVCLATYNGARFLKAQIDSVLSQMRENDELVVSDDGSTDDTLNLLQSYGERLRLVNSTRVGGVVKNFEVVLNAAKNDLIVLCDQDDVWLDGRLDLLRSKLQDVSFLMVNATVTDSALVPTGQDIYDFVNFRPGFFRNFISNGYVGCCLAFRREVLNIALPFPSNILWHDWYIALVAELMFSVARIDMPLALFRRHDMNASNTGERSRRPFFRKIAVRLWMLLAIAIALTRWNRNKLRGAF